MGYLLISEKPAQGHEKFLLETLNILREYSVKGLAVMALTEDKSAEVVSGYWHMGTDGKMLLAGHMQMDAVDQMIRENRGRCLEPDDTDGEEDGDVQ